MERVTQLIAGAPEGGTVFCEVSHNCESGAYMCKLKNVENAPLIEFLCKLYRVLSQGREIWSWRLAQALILMLLFSESQSATDQSILKSDRLEV